MKIKIDKINKKYKNIEVLKDLSYVFETGKMYTITGKSGSGKTTLIKCIAGLLSIEDGNIYFDETNINKMNDEEISSFRNNNIGIVFQDYNLIDFLNVYENIELPLIINNKKQNNKTNELLEFIGLKNRKEHFPNQLSGGEQQRVAVARALVCNPKIILADEPTGNLDSDNKKIIIDTLKKLSNECCVIIVTHDEEVSKSTLNRLKLENGKLTEYEI